MLLQCELQSLHGAPQLRVVGGHLHGGCHVAGRQRALTAVHRALCFTHKAYGQCYIGRGMHKEMHHKLDTGKCAGNRRLQLCAGPAWCPSRGSLPPVGLAGMLGKAPAGKTARGGRCRCWQALQGEQRPLLTWYLVCKPCESRNSQPSWVLSHAHVPKATQHQQAGTWPCLGTWALQPYLMLRCTNSSQGSLRCSTTPCSGAPVSCADLPACLMPHASCTESCKCK